MLDISCSWISQSKSPTIKKFSYFEEGESISLIIAGKKSLEKLLWRLFQQTSSHFLFLKLISASKCSKLLLFNKTGLDLDIIPCLM